MKRREFLAGSAAAALLPLAVRAQGAAALAYPPLLDATQDGAFSLVAQAGTTVFSGRGTSQTWGYNQPFLGPTVRVGRRATRASVSNTLKEAVTVHWHGLVIPGDVDGGPHQPVAPGETWEPVLDITQPAATTWYHTHIHEATARQVYNGLAGVMHVWDGLDDERGLPSAYGVDDLTLVLQDRNFTRSGKMTYNPGMQGRMTGFLGDTMVVNGQIGATAVVPRAVVRLRLLNGSNGRIYTLSMRSGRQMHLVATDSGYLPEPVTLSGLVLSPGERAEVLIDFTDGAPDALTSGSNPNAMMGGGFNPNDRFEVLPFAVDPALPTRITRLPGNIGGELPALDATGAEQRSFTLDMGMGPAMMFGGGLGINGRSFKMNRLDFSVKKGSMQYWRVSANMLMHPLHVHGVRFQVVSENGRQPSPWNQGWKDTVLVNGYVDLLMRFDHPAPENLPYMMHCHILEHEDAGMMAQFTVA